MMRMNIQPDLLINYNPKWLASFSLKSEPPSSVAHSISRISKFTSPQSTIYCEFISYTPVPVHGSTCAFISQILTKWSGKPQVEFTLRNIDLFTSFHHHHHCQQTNRQFTRRHRCCCQLLFRCLARLVPVNRPRGRWLYSVS